MREARYGQACVVEEGISHGLTLATATPDGLTVHSQSKVTERYSFTVPTLVGHTLYVRDRKHIMALDLGKDSAGETN